MDDYMMLEYLRSKDMKDEEFVDKFKDFMYKENLRRYAKTRGYEYPHHETHYYPEEHMITRGIRNHDSYFMHPWYRKEHLDVHMSDSHIDEHTAKELVAEMFHIENDKKFVGEKFSMIRAKEILAMHKASLPENVTAEEIYIAINAQYHDYCKLFKSWFGSDIDKKIIDSALVFWFKDIDYKGESKVMEYFMIK